MTPTLVIHGATGTVGRRVTQLALDAGLRPVLTGRRRARLEELAAPYGLEVRSGDLSPDALDELFDGAAVVLGCVGPYVEHGERVLDAVLRAGAHYVDTTGEPRWVERLVRRHADAARSRGLVLVPGVGLGTVAELVTRVAAERLGAVDDIALGYRITGYRPSRASVQSMIELLGDGAPTAENGTVTYAPAGSRLHPFPGGRGVLFPAPHPMLLAPHWPAARIACYVEGPAARVVALGMSSSARLLTRPRGRALARGAAARLPADTDGDLHRGRARVTAIVAGGDHRHTVAGDVDCVYDLTARSALAAVSTLLTGTALGGVQPFGLGVTDPRLTAAHLGVRLSDAA